MYYLLTHTLNNIVLFKVCHESLPALVFHAKLKPLVQFVSKLAPTLNKHPNFFIAHTEQVWHGETKIWVVRLRSFTWTSPAMLVKVAKKVHYPLIYYLHMHRGDFPCNLDDIP